MTGRVAGKVAFITGGARGQGRSNAVRLAEEGADIIAVDICRDVASVPYPLSTPKDLAETVRQVEATGRRIIAREADVRDFDSLAGILQEAVAELGRLDIVSANAGIVSYDRASHMPQATWDDVIDTNLTGVWHTAKAAIPFLLNGGRGGSIVITSSAAGLKGGPNAAHYVASKHGVVGLMRTLVLELGPQSIRVNTIHPTQVDTRMIMNDTTRRLFCPDLDHPTQEDFESRSQATNALPIPWVDPVDISNALLFLVSDEGRYITGAMLPVDAGFTTK